MCHGLGNMSRGIQKNKNELLSCTFSTLIMYGLISGHILAKTDASGL